MSRLKIAVLFGGCSPEYGVSLQSAAAVLRHMAQSRYEPAMVGISQAGDWFHYTGPVDSIESDTWHNAETCVPAVMRPDRSAPALLVFGPGDMREIKGVFVDNGNGELSFTSNDADTRIVKGIIKINGWNGASFTVIEAPEGFLSVGEEFDFPFAF